MTKVELFGLCNRLAEKLIGQGLDVRVYVQSNPYYSEDVCGCGDCDCGALIEVEAYGTVEVVLGYQAPLAPAYLQIMDAFDALSPADQEAFDEPIVTDVNREVAVHFQVTQ